MRRWEKEVLKTIRAEASTSLQTPGTSLGGHENASEVVGGGGPGQELARVLHELSVEHGVNGQGHDLGSATSTEKKAPGERDEVVAGPEASQAVPPGGEGAAFAQGKPAASERSDDADWEPLLQPAAAVVASGDGADEGVQRTPLQQDSPLARCGEDVTQRGEAGGGAGVHSDLAKAGVRGGDAPSGGPENGEEGRQTEGGGDDVKSIVEKLLRTSSSVALAAARPLSIRPPPVLEVPEDTHKVL